MFRIFYFGSMRYVLLLVAFVVACQPGTKHRRTGLVSNHAMVVTAHPAASKVGVQILEAGGNAVDAAIAVQFALAVVYPGAGNIGGGGFMVYRSNEGASYTLDFREKAPAKATRNMYLDDTMGVIADRSLYGVLAAGVPGTVDGMVQAYEKLGTLPWKSLLQPAIDLAQNGVVLTAREAAKLQANQEYFLQYNDSGNVSFVSNKWKVGDTLVQNDLAQTLIRIRDYKRRGFYEGETADLIVAEIQRGNGIITLDDLKAYSAIWRTPVTGRYKDLEIISMGPPSSGGILLLQLLNMVASHDLRSSGWNTAQTVHLMTEAEKRAYADRARWLGDADYFPVPTETLVSPGYALQRMEGYSPAVATPSALVRAGEPTGIESEETTHFSIVDNAGNALSITTTLNGSFGSKVIVEGAGFLLNNEMDDFSSKPGTPNLYGLVGGEANAIEPGKRMLSSMTPTIITRNDTLWMVVGTPGGSTIITSVFQTILNVYEHGMTMQEAVNAKKFHHQWLPDVLYYEAGAFEQEVIKRLRALGHETLVREPIGRVDAILKRADGSYEAGADPRGDDVARGF